MSEPDLKMIRYLHRWLRILRDHSFRRSSLVKRAQVYRQIEALGGAA